MAQRPVILTGFHFTKTMLAALSESYEIAGHMDKPDARAVPAAAAAARAGAGQHRQRRRLAMR